MKYILLTEEPNNIVQEIIHEFNPIFPDIPITERYPQELLDKCIIVSDDTNVEQGWVYDFETKTFSETKIDIYEPTLQEKIVAIKNRLNEIDLLSIRPLRAIANKEETADDIEKLNLLDIEAIALRVELAELENKITMI